MGLLGSTFFIKILTNANVILGGNENFRVHKREAWDSTDRLDHLANFISFEIDSLGLVDVEPISRGEFNYCGESVF